MSSSVSRARPNDISERMLIRWRTQGNNTFGGALAAVMANVVLIAYIIMAYADDQAEQAEEAELKKKST